MRFNNNWAQFREKTLDKYFIYVKQNQMTHVFDLFKAPRYTS